MDKMIFQDEDKARKFIESLRWADGVFCVHCGAEGAYEFTRKHYIRVNGKRVADPERVVKGLWKCRNCREQFTVRVGTIFEDSHIPLHKWLYATYLICCSKKGISSLQLQRMLDITYKSAWFLSHRIREAMKGTEFAKKLQGIVEVDETYVGSKEKSGRGRSTEKKTPLMALVQRDGEVRTKAVPRVSSQELKSAIRENVDEKSTIMTDDWSAYKGIGKDFKGGHHTVNHSRGEYVRGNVYTNTAESYFALFKRGVHGIFHHISRNHLDRYSQEFAYRWNTRKWTDEDRFVEAIRGAEGKRLSYRVA